MSTMISKWTWQAILLTDNWDTYQIIMDTLRWARRRNIGFHWKAPKNKSISPY